MHNEKIDKFIEHSLSKLGFGFLYIASKSLILFSLQILEEVLGLVWLEPHSIKTLTEDPHIGLIRVAFLFPGDVIAFFPILFCKALDF